MRKPSLGLVVSALLACWLAAPVFAEEIVYLTSGSALPARAHEVRGDMIHLDLGGDGFIAFPLSMVDKIETAAAGVVLPQSFNGSNNIIKPGAPDPGGQFPQRGTSVHAVDAATGFGEPDPHVDRDPNMGISVYRPDPFGSPAKRSHVVTGRRDLIGRPTPQGEGYRGTSRIGNKFVIGAPTSQGRPMTVGIQPVRGVAPPPPPEPPPGEPVPGGTPEPADGEQPGN